MIYSISHVTRYDYLADVPFTRCHLHLLPATRPGQRVLQATVKIDPAPAEQSEHVDFFGNRAVHVAIDVPHRALKLTARASVEVARTAPPDAAGTPTCVSVRDHALAYATVSSRSPGEVAPVNFLFASRLVRARAEIVAWARPSIAPDRPVLEAALELMHRLHAEFEYDPAATDMATPLDQAFAQRRGVCQDFAHLMIAALRGTEVPAAYVSGYLRTLPPQGRPRLQGADATHAWVAVWCGEQIGWVGLDPTNDMIASDDHIEVAIGRDYADVAPVDGVVIAAGGHELAVAVDVEPQPDAQAAAAGRAPSEPQMQAQARTMEQAQPKARKGNQTQTQTKTLR